MKKILCHPLTKALMLFVFCVSTVGTICFGVDSVMRIASSDELLVYYFGFRFYTPVLLLWTAGFIIAALLSLICLCYSAGRSGKDGEYKLAMLHRLPYDLMLATVAIMAYVLFVLTYDMTYWVNNSSGELALMLYLGILYIPANAALFVVLLTSFIARVRAGTWWRNNVTTHVILLCLRLLRWCWRLVLRILRATWRWICRICRTIGKFFTELPTVPQAILFVVSVLFFLLLGIWVEAAYLIFLDAVYAIMVILLTAIFTRRLEKGAEELAKGDIESHVDSSNMFGTYRRHAEHLDHIRDGLGEAVEAQLRSERMKTELITNVSHDIKTPLTSIINYVDLMKKEPIESETVREYLEIMDRQSTRLKKLIEDLIEVSKASTGNVQVDLALTDVDVLLEQVLGEYRERLTAKDLTLCVQNGTHGAQIMSDGKLIWRVFDNLLGNVCKYSMPGTRVYLGAVRRGDEIEITLRNISLYSLNITSEELMERFVRGDRSRHTEGSGLGLSIAKNLVELQKGKLDIVIDGDLFKAILTFQIAEN